MLVAYSYQPAGQNIATFIGRFSDFIKHYALRFKLNFAGIHEEQDIFPADHSLPGIHPGFLLFTSDLR